MRADITFIFDNNIANVIYAHRAIIFSRCPLLDEFIESNCEKASNEFLEMHKAVATDTHLVVYFKDYSAHSFLRMMEYIYTD